MLCELKINPAFIILVPKKEGEKGVIEFRPISLLHVVQEILAKVLVVRLSIVMGGIILDY